MTDIDFAAEARKIRQAISGAHDWADADRKTAAAIHSIAQRVQEEAAASMSKDSGALESAEVWAEHTAAGIWDMPAIENRQELKAALLQVFQVLSSEIRADERTKALEEAARVAAVPTGEYEIGHSKQPYWDGTAIAKAIRALGAKRLRENSDG